MSDNQERRVRPRPSFLRYADPNAVFIDSTNISANIDTILPSKISELQSKISELQSNIEERNTEREQMMIEGKRLVGEVQTADVQYQNLKEQAILQMRSIQTKVEQAEELLADARIDCVSNVSLKQENDNLKDENLILRDQIKELTRQKIESGEKERQLMNDDTSDTIIKDLKQDKERMRSDNNNLAKELEKYKPIEGFVCTTPYNRNGEGDRKTSCTPTKGSPSSFDDIRRNPVIGSRFQKKQPCVAQCFID